MHVLGKVNIIVHMRVYMCKCILDMSVTCDVRAHMCSVCIHVLSIWASVSLCDNIWHVHMCSACVLCMFSRMYASKCNVDVHMICMHTFIVRVRICLIDAHVVYMYVYNTFTCILPAHMYFACAHELHAPFFYMKTCILNNAHVLYHEHANTYI